MPIKIDKKLPAVDILRSENIFVMDDERAEKWNWVTSVSTCILKMLRSLTPHPAMIAMFLPARLCSLYSRGMPFSAVFCCPEVSTRLNPSCSSWPKASSGLRHLSKARWKVAAICPTCAMSLAFLSMSMSPSGVKHPNTTPSTPASLHASMSAAMMSISRSE